MKATGENVAGKENAVEEPAQATAAALKNQHMVRGMEGLT